MLGSSFGVVDGSATCTLAGGSGLVSSTQCVSFSANSTIRAININSTSSDLPAMNFTVNLTMTISKVVGAHSIAVRTISGGSVVDAGSVVLTSIARALTSTT